MSSDRTAEAVSKRNGCFERSNSTLRVHDLERPVAVGLDVEPDGAARLVRPRVIELAGSMDEYLPTAVRIVAVDDERAVTVVCCDDPDAALGPQRPDERRSCPGRLERKVLEFIAVDRRL